MKYSLCLLVSSLWAVVKCADPPSIVPSTSSTAILSTSTNIPSSTTPSALPNTSSTALSNTSTSATSQSSPSPASAPSPLPTATDSQGCTETVTFAYSSFTYQSASIDRYATPLFLPVIYSTPFAPHSTQAASLLNSNIVTTSYLLQPNATDVGIPFGQKSFAALWGYFSYPNEIPFSTTVQATLVPASELIFPPPLYSACANCDSCLTCSKLPSNFIWGVAASAWQTEGGLKFEGRGPAMPDLAGNLEYADLSSDSDAMVADMHYFMYKQDIVRLAAIGVPYFSFSISWTRIVPFGKAGTPINLPGLEHYDDVINTCLEFGIQPIVTLNHFDIPADLDYSDAEFPVHFLYYAKQVMVRYADRVPYWVTFNEPNVASTIFDGLAVSNTQLLLAHAATYRFYKNELNGTGQVLWKWGHLMGVPRDLNNPDDVRAAQRYQDFELGILSNPLFLGTNYPDEVLNTTDFGLKPLTDAQLEYINGTIDLYGIDPYSSRLITSPPGGMDACIANSDDPLWPECVLPVAIQSNGWPVGDASNVYAYITPQYLRQHMSYIWNTFRPKGIFITEFGFNPFAESQEPEESQRYDLERSMYYDSFLKEILKAIHEDGVNIVGALAWSFIDNNEWGSYAQQYGLQTVNRTSGNFERQYKRSFFDFVDFFHKYMEKEAYSFAIGAFGNYTKAALEHWTSTGIPTMTGPTPTGVPPALSGINMSAIPDASVAPASSEIPASSDVPGLINIPDGFGWLDPHGIPLMDS